MQVYTDAHLLAEIARVNARLDSWPEHLLWSQGYYQSLGYRNRMLDMAERRGLI